MVACVKCRREMFPAKTGVELVTMANNDDGTFPYQLWSSDEWECVECGYQVCLVEPTQQPILSHYEEGFEDRIKSIDLQIRER